MNHGFDSRRLTLARRLANLSKKELADDVGVSAASISQYEAGRTVPLQETQVKLAWACRMPVAYFQRSPDRRRPDFSSQSFFRSLRSTSQMERDQADAMAEHVMDIAQVLGSQVKLPTVDVPSFSPTTGDRAEIEGIARSVRDHWNLPDGPVPNVVRLLESKGVVVARLNSTSDEHKLDAFSRWFDENPIVVLWADKGDKARSRFDAAHELGHLVMHGDADPLLIEQERQANHFASALLMPTPAILVDLVRNAPTLRDWPTVFERRAYWGVSAKALLFRSRELGALTESGFRRAMQNYNRHGISDQDGSALGQAEQVALLGMAADAAGFSPDDLALRAHLPASFVAESLGIASSTGDEIDNVVELPTPLRV